MEKATQSSSFVGEEQRCAIITGVARPSGIGRALVHSFLHKGYKVVGIDVKELELRDIEEKEDTTSILLMDRFHFVQGDISDPSQAKLIVEDAVDWFGNCIHVLINNAARTPAVVQIDEPIKTFTETVSINLNGAYYMSECVLPYMPPGSSSIIHISSICALQSEPNTIAYSAAKAGLCGLTHAQAITLAGNVRVNAVLPGWINTHPAGEAVLRRVDHEWHPVGRVGKTKDVAELCLFLCDEERAGFITGQQFVVDGGVTKKMVYPN